MKRFITLASAIFMCLVIITGCKSKQQAVTSLLPAWLEEKTAVLDERHCEITEWEFQGKSYYSVFVKGPDRSYDMNRTTIYDADGNVYLSLGGPRRPDQKETDFFRDAVNKGVVWQSALVKSNKSRTIIKEVEVKSE